MQIPRDISSSCVKRHVYYASVTTDGTGLCTLAQSVSTLLSSTVDFSSMSAVFQKMRVIRVRCVYVPTALWYSSGAYTLGTLSAMGYAPTTSAAPAGISDVLMLRDSCLYTPITPQTLMFQPTLSTGAKGPIVPAALTADLLGYLLLYAMGPASLLIGRIYFQYDVQWFYPA